MPTLSEADREALDADIMADEICNAIFAIKSGKAMGPNGVPIEFQKGMALGIAPHLKNMFEESRDRGILTLDQRLASIVVLLKPNKPANECSSYRPISLISAEAKVLAKLLATRLLAVLPSLIHDDQSGFLPGHNMALNIRRVHNVMGRQSHLQEDGAILSLDATMAFDSMEWSYLFEVLARFEFEPKFNQWIRLLYTDLLGQVRVNNHTS